MDDQHFAADGRNNQAEFIESIVRVIEYQQSLTHVFNPRQDPSVANPKHPIAFVLASTAHGTLILNRNDEHGVGAIRYGVGIEILMNGAFCPDEVELALKLLELRRDIYGDGVVAIDCGANIGVHAIDWGRRMTGLGAGCRDRSPGANLLFACREYRDQQLLQCIGGTCGRDRRRRRDAHPHAQLSGAGEFWQLGTETVSAS